MTEYADVRAVFDASVTDAGKLVFDEPTLVIARLLRMFRGKRVEVTVTREKKLPSDSARGYYFGVVVPAGMGWTGYTKDEMHLEFRRMFLRREVRLLDGSHREEIGFSTTELDERGFSEYMDQCIRFLGEQGVHVPLPNEPPPSVVA